MDSGAPPLLDNENIINEAFLSIAEDEHQYCSNEGKFQDKFPKIVIQKINQDCNKRR